MRTVKNIIIPGWQVIAIEPGENSPMQDHLGGEIAVDTENNIFYAWELFIVVYGTDSIESACYRYLDSV